MTRVLFWGVIAWLVVMALRRLISDGRGSPRKGAAREAAAEDMVRCTQCRLNVPKSEAIAVPGGWACCAAHAPAPRP